MPFISKSIVPVAAFILSGTATGAVAQDANTPGPAADPYETTTPVSGDDDNGGKWGLLGLLGLAGLLGLKRRGDDNRDYARTTGTGPSNRP